MIKTIKNKSVGNVCSLRKVLPLSQRHFPGRTLNSDMNDGPIILTHGVMEEKLTKRNFIFGGTHSANRVCRSNPA